MFFAHPALNFKSLLFAAAAAALILGVWVTGAELVSPHSAISGLPGSSIEAQRFRANAAARIGLLRGDLWADDALLRSGFDLGTGAFQARTQANTEDGRLVVASAERALSLSPLDSRIWLLLAAQETSAPLDREKAASALEMAYLTGQGDAGLLPARLMIAARSGALSNKTIQDFVQTDLNFIFLKLPGLKSVLLEALRVSTGADRAVLEHMISAADPAFLQAYKRRPE